MVKQKPSNNLDRNMNAYKMRTSYGSSINNSQTNSTRSNHVQVAHSNGCCCSSKKTHHVAPRQQQQQQPVMKQQHESHQPTAHEISHSRLDSPDPFYYRNGRIKKNPYRNKKSSQHSSLYGRNQVHTIDRTTNYRQTTQTYPSERTKNYQQTTQTYQSVQPTNQRQVTQTYQPVQAQPQKKSSCCTIL